MKKIWILYSFLLSGTILYGQLNMEVVSRLTYPVTGNDIWGYVGADGTEYALMGVRNGLSIVSLANPTNPTEVAFVPGANSTWRDIKTWGDYAYVTTDENNTKEGLVVVYLGDLPNSIDYFNYRPKLTEIAISEADDTLNTCHNLYIDEFGYCYLTGCNLNNGGVIVFDVFSSEDGTPIYVGPGADTYSHDVYVRDNIVYTSEIFEGGFGIYDMSDKDTAILMGFQETPFEFCHNTWLSDDGNTLYTTDERRDASTAAYDISDFSDIEYLDEFRPPNTIGEGVIPHNVHVFGNFLVISHYVDGCIIVDATHPDNLIEVGNYDTYLGNETGSHGAWGAYPYLPSGLIIVSDIDGGLFVLNPEYKQAAYLEGKITNKETGTGIFNAKIQIESSSPNFNISNLIGNYKTGQVESGTFPMKVHALGYFDENLEVTLVNGEVTIQNVELTPLPQYSYTGKIVDKETGDGIEGATFFLEGEEITYTTESDENGEFDIPEIFLGDYQISVGIWGYENVGLEDVTINTSEPIVFELESKYEDNFSLDLGWDVIAHADKGDWVRAVPLGTIWNDEVANPDVDIDTDFGNKCYVTGNGERNGRSGDVDRGETVLSSPNMDLTFYNRPILSYNAWFFNAELNSTEENDSLWVVVHNGFQDVVLEVLDDSRSEWRERKSFDLASFIEITNTMWVTVHVSDRNGSDDVTEGGFDYFEVTDGLTENDFLISDENVKFRVFPNPFGNEFTIDYKTNFPFKNLKARLYNLLGQELFVYDLTGRIGSVQLSPTLANGTYLLVLEVDGLPSDAFKIIAQ